MEFKLHKDENGTHTFLWMSASRSVWHTVGAQERLEAWTGKSPHWVFINIHSHYWWIKSYVYQHRSLLKQQKWWLEKVILINENWEPIILFCITLFTRNANIFPAIIFFFSVNSNLSSLSKLFNSHSVHIYWKSLYWIPSPSWCFYLPSMKSILRLPHIGCKHNPLSY